MGHEPLTRRRWGRAGVRLTDAEARAADQRRARARHAQAATEQNAYRQWDAGLLVPHQITIALDARELYGPEVDAACGAAEPDVDRWEAGELYPTWDQLKALSKLTGCALKFFFLPPTMGKSSLDFHLPARDLQARLPIARFQPGAREARPTPIQGTLL